MRQLEINKVIVIEPIIGSDVGHIIKAIKDFDHFKYSEFIPIDMNGALRYLVARVVDKTSKSVVLSWLGRRIQ